MSGQIEESGERYLVTRPGGEVSIAAGNVMLVCDSLEDAYQQRRGRLAQPRVEDHLTLGEWCLRYGLLKQAQRELDGACALEPRHPRLALLERRLKALSERSSQPAAPAPARAAEQPAAAELALAPEPSEQLSPAVVERFTRKVQPVLVNNCTASGCHRLGSSEAFQLDRAVLHGLGNRRSTMRNLAAALTLVDREQPQLSPLLTMPRQTHGGMTAPVFGPNDEAAFRHLAAWVALVTRQADSSPARPSPTAGGEDHDVEEEAASASGEQVPGDEDFIIAEREHWLQIGSRAVPWQPRDPFDPEIFNRETARRAGTSRTGTAAESR